MRPVPVSSQASKCSLQWCRKGSCSPLSPLLVSGELMLPQTYKNMSCAYSSKQKLACCATLPRFSFCGGRGDSPALRTFFALATLHDIMHLTECKYSHEVI